MTDFGMGVCLHTCGCILKNSSIDSSLSVNCQNYHGPWHYASTLKDEFAVVDVLVIVPDVHRRERAIGNLKGVCTYINYICIIPIAAGSSKIRKHNLL